jgi:hypothetical protein
VKFEKPQDGTTPMMVAASQNNLEMVKMFLDAKAEVNVQDEVYWSHEYVTALMMLFFSCVYAVSFNRFFFFFFFLTP